MMYNTGDLGKWLESGEIDILGRTDDQVKVKVDSSIFMMTSDPPTTLINGLRGSESSWTASHMSWRQFRASRTRTRC